MALTKRSVDMAIDTVKDFFKNLFRPNMELEDLKEITFPRFQEVIRKNEEKGLEYGGGKFYVKYVDEGHFQLEFEMYFKDSDGQWHKLANKSELREIELLEDSLIRTLKTLQVADFSIDYQKDEDKKISVDENKI